MSGKLSIVEPVDAPELDREPLPQGRFARAVAKLRFAKQSISDSPRFSHMAQLRGLGSAAWLVGFVGSILILNRFVSPIITELAMTTLIAPIAALMLVILGEFDFTKLTTMVTSNAGIVFATGGMIIAALFVQNVVKMALLTKSFTADSHKQYRTYALASMLTPVTTSALWYAATKLGYFLGAKSISLGVMAIFASGAVGEALKSVDPMNATTADLATVASAMSNGLRWGLGFIVAVHLYFVFKSYGLVHKTLNYLFDMTVQKVVKDEWHVKVGTAAKNNGGKLFTFFVVVPALVFGVASCMPTSEELKAREAQIAADAKIAAERTWRVACIDGATYATEEGRAHRLTNADGSSHCTASAVQKMLILGKPFSKDATYRNEIVIREGAGYGKCPSRWRDSDGHLHEDSDTLVDCRKDLTVARDVRYWLELPEGLPKDVKMPALPMPVK